MKKVTSLLSIILVLSLVNVSFATNLYNNKKKVSNSIKENKQIIKVVKDKKVKVQRSIEEIVTKKQVLTKRINKTKKDIDKKNQELKVIKEDLNKAVARVKKQEEDFSKRVKAMYDRSNESTIEIFFKSDGISDFMNRLDFANAIAKQDQEVLVDFKEEKQKIKKLEEVEKKNLDQLSELKERQLKSKAELVVVEKELKERAAELQQEIDKQKRIISKKLSELRSIEAEIKAFEAKLAAQRAKKNQANGKVTFIGGSSKGWRWPLPANRAVRSPFGVRIHPIYGTRRMHNGIDITSPTGTPIVAAKSGTVVLARYFGGYGNAVVISHGNGLSTMYAHASSLNVSAGQSVKAGQVIARVGSTGWSTGPHLHFGVKTGGGWVNPLGYVR